MFIQNSPNAFLFYNIQLDLINADGMPPPGLSQIRQDFVRFGKGAYTD